MTTNLIDQELADAVKTATSGGVGKVSAAKVAGQDVAAAIVGYAIEHGYDHIVMGSTGHTAFGRLLTGSVVDEVLSQTHPPVTVV